MNIIIENFIPHDDVNKLETKLEFSEELDDWTFKDPSTDTLGYKIKSVFNLSHPLCEFSRMAIQFGDQNPRFRPENILQLDLEAPERTTEDVEQMGQSSKVQDAI